MDISQYEKLKELIQQANPEIMELRFGCWIDYEVFPMRAIRKGVVSQNLDNAVCVLHDGLIPDFIVIKRDIKKILGRPIRLADVLATVIIKLPGLAEVETIEDSENCVTAHTDFIEIIAQWKLQDDNLDHQSDETKQFLMDLLVS